MAGTRRTRPVDEDLYGRNRRLIAVQRAARDIARHLRTLMTVLAVTFVAGLLLWWWAA